MVDLLKAAIAVFLTLFGILCFISIVGMPLSIIVFILVYFVIKSKPIYK
jgi:hypothetical protein